MRVRSLRFRMMLLFCAVVAVLLAASYLGFYALFSRQVRAQMDRQILNTASPVVADLASDPTEQDVNQLDVPGEYFELLDASARVAQSSVNLQGRRLDLGSLAYNESRPVFLTLNDRELGRLRLAAVPFRRGNQTVRLVLAMPTRDADRVLADIRGMILVLLPISLLLAAGISAWYVGRSLRPVAELTRHASEMSELLADPSRLGRWRPQSS
jgi:hypothetical protein